MSNNGNHWYRCSVSEVLAELKTSTQGLSQEDAEERLLKHGENRLPNRKSKSALLRFFMHFNDVLIYILLVAGILTAVMGHVVDTFVIIGVAFINALIGFIQETKANNSLKSINNMLSSEVEVLRDGAITKIPTYSLTPGDVVIIRSGDKISADLRLIETHNLHADESILTGESLAVEKNTVLVTEEVGLGDRHNMLYSGTTVSSGSGKGVVVATGRNTELGNINEMLDDIRKQKTPLLVQIDKLGKIISVNILLMMAALFFYSLAFREMPLSDLLLSIISLAVASIPEGLPAIISIILSIGCQSMARQKAIIRKIPTVETLGAMTVICSDKTGTLTMNEMTVKSLITVDGDYTVEGLSYEPKGSIKHAVGNEELNLKNNSVLEKLFITFDVCNDSSLIKIKDEDWKISGSPTDGALKVLALKANLPSYQKKLISKIPFDSEHKYMSTLHEIQGGKCVLVTGAPDVIIKLCEMEATNSGVKDINTAWWNDKIKESAKLGLRMVAAAWKPADDKMQSINHDDLKNGLILLGIAGIIDPPRPEAIVAIDECQKAGVRVKMITGDHPETARSIGKQLGIHNFDDVITGSEISSLDDRKLKEAVMNFEIFARTSPQDKLRLVKALQSQGQIVGMTGDGVNDAPALKQADVGIAMGIKGTEVSKEAADMVLTDDNFVTIANAIKEGRRVYDNLKKTILFILPTSLAQGLLIIISLLVGNIMPLTPVQILWMNMATAATLSFGLAYEAAELNTMRRPPRQKNQHIVNGFAIWRVVFVGSIIALTAFLLEDWLQTQNYSAEFIRTVLLHMLVVVQWFYMLNCRVSEGFSLNLDLLKSRQIWIVSLILLLLQSSVIYIPVLQKLFGTVNLPSEYWILTVAIGMIVFIIIELEKALFVKIKAFE